MSSVDQTTLLRQMRQAIQSGDYAQAIQTLEQLIHLARSAGNNGMAGRHLGNLALIYYRLEQPQHALEKFHQALECARLDQDQFTESGVLGNIGNILRETGQYPDALAYLQKALDIANAVEDIRGRGIWLSNLGLVYDDMRQPARALELHREAVDIARQLQDQRGLAARLANEGNSYVALGALSQALECFEESVSLYGEIGDAREIALKLGVIGNVYSEIGRAVDDQDAAVDAFDHALRYYTRSLYLMRSLGDVSSEAGLLRSMGNALANRGQYDEAIQRFQQAISLFESMNVFTPIKELKRSIRLAEQYKARYSPS
jgi:tetratricopeptide (TPR) repeat protein